MRRVLVVTMLGCLVSLATAASARAGETSTCQFEITGDAKLSVHVSEAVPPNPAGKEHALVGTDYWNSEATIKRELETLNRVGGGFGKDKPSKSDIDKKVQEDLKKDPRVILLMITCSNESGSLILGATNQSKYADVPRKPAKYAIVPSDSKKPGAFTVVTHVKDPAQRGVFHVEQPGELEITRFDGHALTGKFSFKAVSGKKNIAVSGSFALPCYGDNCK